jgi:hypothetical protein
MLLDDIERTCRERTNTVIHLLGALPAATFQLTTELRAVVHPFRHRRTSHPSSLSGLTMRATGQQHVDSEMLRVGQSGRSGLVRNGHQDRISLGFQRVMGERSAARSGNWRTDLQLSDDRFEERP